MNLHFSLGLQPEARYPTRSSLVSGSATTIASSVGGLAATMIKFAPLSFLPVPSKRKICVGFAELDEEKCKPEKTCFTLDPALHRTNSD